MTNKRLSRSVFLRVALGAISIAALGVLGLSLLGAQHNSGVGPPSPPQFIGDVPLPLPESRVRLRQDTPLNLVRTALEARDRKDLAALARCSSTSAGRLQLNQLDASRAERDFFDSGDALWTAVAAAVRTEAALVTSADVQPTVGEPPVDARGEVAVPVASAALEEQRLRIVRIGGAWYFEVEQ